MPAPNNIRTATNQMYWIYDGALTFTINALGDYDKISVSVAAGAIIKAYAKIDNVPVIDYGADGNPRSWALLAAPTHLNSSDAVHVYARLSKTTDTALIIYPYEMVDIDPNDGYYYIYLGSLTASLVDNVSVNREWSVGGTGTSFTNYGELDTYKQLIEQGSEVLSRMFVLDSNNVIWTQHNLSFVAGARLLLLRMQVLGGEGNVDVTTIANTHSITDEEFRGNNSSIITSAAMVKYNHLREAILEELFNSRFLRKDQDDTTTFKLTMGEANIIGNEAVGGNATIVGNEEVGGNLNVEGGAEIKGLTKNKGGLQVGTYTGNTILGTGAEIDSAGNAVVESLYARSFIGAPEYRFNKITVTEGEQWNTNGYGVIETVQVISNTDGIITLHMEEGEYPSIAKGDFCRGIYNAMAAGVTLSQSEYSAVATPTGCPKDKGWYENDGNTYFPSEDLSVVSGKTYYIRYDGSFDECGFPQKYGFFTSFFHAETDPEDIGDEDNHIWVFRYRLRTSENVNFKNFHPVPFMKFAQYGNDLDFTRQSSSYFCSHPHSYEIIYEGVNDWVVQSPMITYIHGWLGGFTILLANGQSKTFVEKDHGLYVQKNIYFGQNVMEIDPETLEDLQRRLENYTVDMDIVADTITVDAEGNVVGGLYYDTTEDGETVRRYRLYTNVIAKKGNDLLILPDSGSATDGKYTFVASSDECTVVQEGSRIYITAIANINNGATPDGFDYDAMRAVKEVKIDIDVDCEGKRTLHKTYCVTVEHIETAYINADMINERSLVSWNTKTLRWIGLPLVYQIQVWHNSDRVTIGATSDVVVTGTLNGTAVGVQVLASASDALTGTNKVGILKTLQVRTMGGVNYNIAQIQVAKLSDNLDDGELRLSNAITVSYAGVSYVRTLDHVMQLASDTNVYSIQTNVAEVVYDQNENTIEPSSVTCKVFCDSSDDKHFQISLSSLSSYSLGLTYKRIAPDGTAIDFIDQSYTSAGVAITSAIGRVEFYLRSNDYTSQGLLVDSETVPVLTNGLDGTSPIFADATNEMDSVACNSSGVVQGNQSVQTAVSIWKGSARQAITAISCKVNNVTLNTSFNTDGYAFSESIITGECEIRVKDGTTISDKTIATITVNATIDGVSESRDLEITINGVRAGSDGRPAELYSLLPSLNNLSFARVSSGGLTPASRSLSLSVKKVVGSTCSEQTIAQSGLTIRYSTSALPSAASGGTAWGTSDGTTGLTWSNNVATIANSVAFTNLYIAAFNSSGTLVDRETIPVIKDGDNGADGIVYELRLSGNQVVQHEDGTRSPSSVTIRAYKRQGTENTAAYTGDIVLYKANGDVITAYENVSSQTVTISQAESFFPISVKLFKHGSSPSEILAEASISLVKDGQQGETGLTGQIMYPPVEFVRDGAHAYVNNSNGISTVVVTVSGELYYYKCKETYIPTSSSPLPQNDSTHWDQFSRYNNLATDLLLANRGYASVWGAGELWVGAAEKASGVNGWVMNNASIKHNVTGLELTADGYINDPNGLHFRVDGRIDKNPNLLYNAYFDSVMTEINDDIQIPESYLSVVDGGVHGEKLLCLNVEGAGTVETRFMGGSGMMKGVKITDNAYYIFSAYARHDDEEDTAWIKLYMADNEDMTDNLTEISTLSVPYTHNLSLIKSSSFNIGANKYFAIKIGMTCPSGGTNMFVDAVKLERGGVVTPMCEMSVNDKLLPTGIDIENRTIRLTTDNLICQNNDGEKTMWLDSIGNLATTGNIMSGVRNIGSVSDFAKIAYHLGEVTLFDCDTVAGAAANKLYNNLSDRGISGTTWGELHNSWVLDVFRATDVINFTQSFGGNEDDINIVLPFFVFKQYIENNPNDVYEYYVCRTYTNYKSGIDHLVSLDEMQQLVGKRLTFTGNGTYKRFLIPNVIEHRSGSQYYYTVDSANPFLEFELYTAKGYIFEYQACNIEDKFCIFPRCVTRFLYLNEVDSDWNGNNS